MNRRTWMLWLAGVLLSLPAMLEADRPAEGVSLNVVPDRVSVGAFYHGTDVEVSAETPRCDATVLILESEGTDIVLNRKGRLGPVWMNVAQITAQGAPGVYILASSENLAAICSAQEREKLGLGYEAVRRRVTFMSDKPLSGKEFDELLKLKERAGTYNEELRIEMIPFAQERQTITASIPLPSVMPSGEYLLRLYCFEDGANIAGGSAHLTIERAGLPRLEYKLAHQHAATYGIVAVLAAMAAGLATGLAFSAKGGRGH